MRRFTVAEASWRASSEDRVLVVDLGRAWVVAVADGTGGIGGGAAAAESFIAGVRRAAERASFDPMSPQAWTALFETLDADILRDPIAGETTGVALAISPTAIVGASCGDSQAWRVTANGSEELTGDQPRKIRLGTGRVQARGFCAGAAGTLIVGTDGLFDFARWDDIAATVRSGSENLAHALVELVRARYHRLPDDLAVVVGELK